MFLADIYSGQQILMDGVVPRDLVLNAPSYQREMRNLYVPHQANVRILKAVAERLGLPPEKVMLNLDRYGNTSAASIPIALDEALQRGLIKEGSLVMLGAFGAGLTWASALIRW